MTGAIRALTEMLPHVPQRLGGDVCPPIGVAVGSDPPEQQAGTAADLEHTPRLELQDALDRLLDPRPHLVW